MIGVLFEVEPHPGHAPRYFELAAGLAPHLAEIEGFVSVERFQSLSRPDAYLSMSWWRDEAAVRAWRNLEAHRSSQREGREAVFARYRIRVVDLRRDYTGTERAQAPADSNDQHAAG